MKVEDFGDLTRAEAALIAHLQQDEPGTFWASDRVPPEDAPIDLHIRASLIRALVLRKVDDCPLPDRGLLIAGAYIRGDGKPGGESRGLDLAGATLSGNLALLYCKVPDLILLRGASISSLFLNGSILSAANVLSADGMEAKGSVFLRAVEAAGAIRLLGAKLRGVLDCSIAKLDEEADTLNADRLEAKGGVILRDVEAAGAIRLAGATLGSDFDCSGAKLNAAGKVLRADGVHIAGTWFWRGGCSSRGAIDLTGAEIGFVADDPAHWPAELLLDRLRYGAFVGKGVSATERGDWLSRMRPTKYGDDFWPRPYEECARALRESGHGADAREVLIEKERLQRKARRTLMKKQLDAARAARDEGDASAGFRPRNDQVVATWWRWRIAQLWDGVLHYSVDYGRRPGKAALWLGLMLLLGWFFFGRAAGFGEIKPNLPQIQRAPEWVACAENPDRSSMSADAQRQYAHRARPGENQVACFLRQPEAASYPHFNPLVYSADTLLPIVAFEMQSYWIPDDSKPIGEWARWYLWFHIFAGWGLTLLAVAGFSGLIKTDNTK